MIRLFFSLLLFGCLCTIYPNLFRLIKADENEASTAPTSCNTAGLCPDLGNISYPFGAAPSCAASDSFLVNCSDSSHAYWDAFTFAVKNDTANLGPPAVTGIFTTGNSMSFINLTWSNPLENKDACVPLLAVDADLYIPNVIDLNSFANGSFLLSYENHILLFNCASLPPSADSSVCQAYQQQCNLALTNPKCMQIPVPTQQLKLHEALSNYSCTHFQFLVAAETLASNIPAWSPGLIQLFYADVKCMNCYVSYGTCVYDKTTYTYEFCACGNGQVSNADCSSIQAVGCTSLLCKKSAEIAVTGTGTAILVGLIVVIWFRRTRSFFTKTRSLRLAKRPTRQKLVGSRSFVISHFDVGELTECPTEFPYASIALATEEFKSLLGEGGFGAVYKGILCDATGNVQIAVKVLQVMCKQSKKHFLNEVASIGRIHHVNVVQLLGFCIEESHEMLVYEYVVNGSLDKWLLHQSGSQNRVLRWEERYAIAIGIAKGLNYLHEECRHRIVHCDIKPQNILLDEQMCPKIADFGLAKLMSREESQVATLARGTPGYMGPEFWLRGECQLSTKFDVYSYGMVLLELISGQRNFGDDVCFPEMAHDAAMRGKFESVLDVKLGIAKAEDGEFVIVDCMQRQQVRTALLVALWCIQDHPMNRPSMTQVVQYLEGGAPIDEQPPRSAIASLLISSSAQQPLYTSNGAHYDITPISGGR